VKFCDVRIAKTCSFISCAVDGCIHVTKRCDVVVSNLFFWSNFVGSDLSPNFLNNKLTNTRQHNKYLLEYIDYMFRPVNRSSSGLQQNKSQVLFRYWDPNIFTVVKYIKSDTG